MNCVHAHLLILDSLRMLAGGCFVDSPATSIQATVKSDNRDSFLYSHKSFPKLIRLFMGLLSNKWHLFHVFVSPQGTVP